MILETTELHSFTEFSAAEHVLNDALDKQGIHGNPRDNILVEIDNADGIEDFLKIAEQLGINEKDFLSQVKILNKSINE